MELSRGRKIAFAALGLAMTLVLLEVVSFLVLSAVEKRWMTFSTLRTLRAARLEPDAAPVNADAAINPNVATSVIHPFLGYVRDTASIPLGTFNAQAHEFGFIQNRHSLFQEPSADKVVVAVTGGSVARSVVFYDESLRRALAKSPRFAGREVVVLSLAAGGYKQPHQLMTLNYFLALGAHFDILINLDGFNDVTLAPARIIPDGTFPFFPFHWMLRVGNLNLDQRRRIGELTYLRERRRRSADLFSQAPWRFSMTASLVWKGLDNLGTRRITRSQERLDVMGLESDYQAQGPRRTYAGEKQMYRDLARVWRRASYQMHLLSQGSRIEYHHVLQPNQYLPESKALTRREKATAWKANHPYREHVEKGYPWLIRFGRELREQGVAFHDLTRIFVDNHETLYRDPCCHLNQEGNDLLAEAVAQALEGSR